MYYAMKIVSYTLSLYIAAAPASAHEDAPYVQYLGTGAADIHRPDHCECKNCSYTRAEGGRNKRRYSSLYAHPGVVIDFSITGMTSLEECGIHPRDINYLLFTHSHSDHFNVSALMELIAARGDAQPLSVFGNSTVVHLIKQHIESLETDIALTVTAINAFQDFVAGEWQCTSLAANHAATHEECLLYTLTRNGRSVLYATDTTWFPARTFFALQNKKLDIAIVEATFGPETEAAYLITHMNFHFNALIREHLIKKNILKPEGIYALTHLSLHYVAPYDKIHPEMLRQGMLIPHDGLKLTFD
ncbi:MAG: hypothetical protein GXY44_14095 [Phycisphaerales bacterium]|nr:hypothetical protein [Phycisphaerales bacterium]